ncbi:hypothetical protein QBC44DRAFT_369505 [Cladorrhinum sp. PSN332]|nr:hypothetical protein QBC44DRAFT_369505 [Cladorrhinum sp. PSN332]
MFAPTKSLFVSTPFNGSALCSANHHDRSQPPKLTTVAFRLVITGSTIIVVIIIIANTRAVANHWQSPPKKSGYLLRCAPSRGGGSEIPTRSHSELKSHPFRFPAPHSTKSMEPTNAADKPETTAPTNTNEVEALVKLSNDLDKLTGVGGDQEDVSTALLALRFSVSLLVRSLASGSNGSQWWREGGLGSHKDDLDKVFRATNGGVDGSVIGPPDQQYSYKNRDGIWAISMFGVCGVAGVGARGRTKHNGSMAMELRKAAITAPVAVGIPWYVPPEFIGLRAARRPKRSWAFGVSSTCIGLLTTLILGSVDSAEEAAKVSESGRL